MRYLAYLGGLLGLAVIVYLVIHSDPATLLQTLRAGGSSLLWLAPYRELYFLLYAAGWLIILRPADPSQRAGLWFLLWVSNVREAIDRLLPVASVGGGVVGVRLLRWRGLAAAPAGASVIAEIVLTVIALYLFTAAGLVLLVLQPGLSAAGAGSHRLGLALLLSLPVPVISVLLLRHGSAVSRLQRFLSPLIGARTLADQAAALDHELRAAFRRWRGLSWAGALQVIALFSGAFEVWFALRVFGHPVGAATAIVLESTTQALRNLAFMVPAGLGVQEAGLMLFGHALGISGELALAVSTAKRLREVLCGIPALLSWQWLEFTRTRS